MSDRKLMEILEWVFARRDIDKASRAGRIPMAPSAAKSSAPDDNAN
jgi:hypothetical protein